MTARRLRAAPLAAPLAAALLLAACAGDGAPPRPDDPPADGQGVIRFEDYAVVEAREGDTVASLARRAGVDAEALAAYNGLPLDYRPRAGAQLVLPPG
jgi:hypothetical protein